MTFKKLTKGVLAFASGAFIANALWVQKLDDRFFLTAFSMLFLLLWASSWDGDY